MRTALRLLALVFVSSALHAQATPASEDLRYVLPRGAGDITVPTSGWQPQELSLLDNGTRLVVQLGKQGSDLVASYVLFPGAGGTSESCRNRVMDAVIADLTGNGTLADQQQSTRKTKNGITLAVASYRVTKAGDRALDQENVFGFYGNAQTCLEVHVAKPHFHVADKPQIDAVLESFTIDPAYIAKPADYGVVASLFFTYLQDFPSATVYYQRALDTLPAADITAPSATLLGRMTAFQLASSCGMAGDLARSRAVSEAAIARDPDFPLFYYDLANADAESGNSTATEQDLKKAFDRRKNLPPGLKMPDPEADGAFQKLQQNPQFTAFLRGLPKD